MRTALSRERFDEALITLGELLDEAGETFDLALIGGGALLLVGLIQRPTEDLDVVARVVGDKLEGARPLPELLQRSVLDVAGALDLPDTWLNSGPAMVFRKGLPDGFLERAETRRYGALTIRIASRVDQIALKLDASADTRLPRNRHIQDLEQLNPSGSELLAARRWCAGHRSREEMGAVDETMTRLLMGGGDDWR